MRQTKKMFIMKGIKIVRLLYKTNKKIMLWLKWSITQENFKRLLRTIRNGMKCTNVLKRLWKKIFKQLSLNFKKLFRSKKSFKIKFKMKKKMNMMIYLKRYRKFQKKSTMMLKIKKKDWITSTKKYSNHKLQTRILQIKTWFIWKKKSQEIQVSSCRLKQWPKKYLIIQ